MASFLGRAGAVLGPALLACVAVASLAAATCPYPLGPFAAAGNIVTHQWGDGPVDVETGIVEATLIHGQKSFGMVVNANGQLHFLYDDEVEYELPDGSPAETQSIYYKEYSQETGWDVPLLDLANADVNNPMPGGRNVAPHATSVGDTFWGVWEVSGDPAYRINGSSVLVRGKSPAGFTPITLVSPGTVDSRDRLARIQAFGNETFIAWQTNLGENDSLSSHIVGRTWDGATLGPIENISVQGDGFSDQVVRLATDGTRVIAAWLSQNSSELGFEGEWSVKVAVRSDTGVWGPEVIIAPTGKWGAKTPDVAWYLDRIFVAWVTDNPEVTPRGDYDVVMRSYDPATGALSPMMTPNGNDFQVEEADASLFPWTTAQGGDGKLHLLFSSTSSPPGIATSGADNDIYHRTYDGAVFSNATLLSDPLDNGFVDVLPGFFTANQSLFAYFLSNICLPGCGHETDWREMTRLLSRQPRDSDDVRANFTLASSMPSAFAASALVTFKHANGTRASGEGYYVRTGAGQVFPVSLANGVAEVPITFNSSVVKQVEASWCGKALPTTEDLRPPPDVPKPSPASDVVMPALLAAALVAALGSRRARRP
jgi:hypothetical protein